MEIDNPRVREVENVVLAETLVRGGADGLSAQVATALLTMLCQVCHEKSSKYKAPCCLVPYCSVACYKIHKGKRFFIAN